MTCADSAYVTASYVLNMLGIVGRRQENGSSKMSRGLTGRIKEMKSIFIDIPAGEDIPQTQWTPQAETVKFIKLGMNE